MSPIILVHCRPSMCKTVFIFIFIKVYCCDYSKNNKVEQYEVTSCKCVTLCDTFIASMYRTGISKMLNTCNIIVSHCAVIRWKVRQKRTILMLLYYSYITQAGRIKKI